MNELSITFNNRQLRKLIMPLIIEQFLSITVGLADSIMVASVGEAAVSAVSLVDSVNVLVFFTFTALATGGAVVCGQFIGQRNYQRANDSAQQLLLFVGLFSAAVFILLYVCKNFVLRGLFGNIDDDVMDYCSTYFLIVEASVPFIAIYSAGAALFRVMGNSAVSMRVSIVMNIINVGGNALLIFGLGMGVEGVAIPTLLSRVAGGITILVLLNNEKYLLHLSKPFRFTLDKVIIANILRVGVPSGLESSFFHLGKIMLLSVVSSLGTASIAANAIGNSIGNFQILAAQSIGVGMITVVSQCTGARDFDAARFYTRKLMKWAYTCMLLSNILIFALMPLILTLYNVSPEAAYYAKWILILHGGIGIILWPVTFTLPQALKAAGDTTYVMIMAVCSMWIFRIGTGVLFAKYLGFGVLGIWYAMFIDWCVRTFFTLIRWRGDKWQKKYIE